MYWNAVAAAVPAARTVVDDEDDDYLTVPAAGAVELLARAHVCRYGDDGSGSGLCCCGDCVTFVDEFLEVFVVVMLA